MCKNSFSFLSSSSFAARRTKPTPPRHLLLTCLLAGIRPRGDVPISLSLAHSSPQLSLYFLPANPPETLTLTSTAAVVPLKSPANGGAPRSETLSIIFASSSSTRWYHACVPGGTVAVERVRRPERQPPVSSSIPSPTLLHQRLNLVPDDHSELRPRLHPLFRWISSIFWEPDLAAVFRRRTSPPW